jgi:transposase
MLFIGIDWSQDKHDIGYLDNSGKAISQQVIDHDQRGFQGLHKRCQELGSAPNECYIGIETSYNLLVDELWSYGYEHIYVIPPSVVKSCRGRYSSSGARTDQRDALTLADLLRTDRQRLQPWQPDCVLTRQMRSKVTLLYQLTKQIVATRNRLRAVLQRYYPGILVLFGDLSALTAQAFIQAYPTPAAAAQLSHEEFLIFLRQQRYPQAKRLAAKLPELWKPSLETLPETAEIYQSEALLHASLLTTLVRAKRRTQSELTALFQTHPDAAIFSSLPGLGPFLAPALLVKFGDHRNRFPTAASVQALAGTCPVTDSSGKRHRIRFRRSCDREFRHFAQQWAIASVRRTHSSFAVAYWHQARSRNMSKTHAFRCLANRWLAIAWRLWQNHTTYDESYHLQQRTQRQRPAQLN